MHQTRQDVQLGFDGWPYPLSCLAELCDAELRGMASVAILLIFYTVRWTHSPHPGKPPSELVCLEGEFRMFPRSKASAGTSGKCWSSLHSLGWTPFMSA